MGLSVDLQKEGLQNAFPFSENMFEDIRFNLPLSSIFFSLCSVLIR